MNSRPWFERWPKRLKLELEALGQAGIKVEVDNSAKTAGILKLGLQTPEEHPAGRHDLLAVFPEEYPFFRPEVFASSLVLPRHQNPFARNLCLLGRSTRQWDPVTTLAELLHEQLPEVIEHGRCTDPEELSEFGEQAEPRSVYYSYEPGAVVFVDPAQRVDPEVDHGTFVIGHQTKGQVFRGALLRVRDEQGKDVYQAKPVPFDFSKRDGFIWVRAGEPPPQPDAESIHEWLRQTQPSAVQASESKWTRWNGKRCYILGVLYQEEVGPGRLDDAWLFLISQPSGTARGSKNTRYLARPAPYSESFLFERTPELRFLRDANVALAGVGCLGAPIALELARSGVARLSLLDGDDVEAATTARWPIGLGATGYPKVCVLQSTITSAYPWTEVVPYPWRLGEVFDPDKGAVSPDFDTPQALIDSWLSGANLILDATAERGVHFYLMQEAKRRGLPYLLVSGTEGGWGGRLFRALPDTDDACWSCFEHWRHDDELKYRSNVVPEPPAAPIEVSNVQPRGCADPTFTGAGFDVGQIAVAGARFAVMTLSSQLGGEYPDVSWNYASISLRSDEGDALAPAWRTESLNRHPSCSLCRG